MTKEKHILVPYLKETMGFMRTKNHIYLII